MIRGCRAILPLGVWILRQVIQLRGCGGYSPGAKEIRSGRCEDQSTTGSERSGPTCSPLLLIGVLFGIDFTHSGEWQACLRLLRPGRLPWSVCGVYVVSVGPP